MRENELLVKLRDGQELTMRDQILLIVRILTDEAGWGLLSAAGGDSSGVGG